MINKKAKAEWFLNMDEMARNQSTDVEEVGHVFDGLFNKGHIDPNDLTAVALYKYGQRIAEAIDFKEEGV